MEKYVLKASGNCKIDDMSIALKANIGIKFSSINDDAKLVHIKNSLARRNDKLATILNSKTFQPLFIDSSDNNPEIGTSSNICDDENVQPHSNNEETPNRLLNGNLLENMTSTPIDNQISAINGNMVTQQLNHHLLARLQRDLGSPSAATRVRAMRALKSPANGPYNMFDVPHEEQDIITEEERQEVIPKTIQDVMKDVIVYVEMRYGDENRTAGIKGVISELGATVNDNFNRNTTHVIIKNGMQSTYNKAKMWNIPIVSILWIEACKKQLRLVDPSKYTITNVERYENPELYKKVKVKKFFPTEHELKIKKPKKVTPTHVEKFKPIKVPKKATDNLTGILNDFRDRLANNEDGIDYFSNNSKLAGLINDRTPSKSGPSARRQLYSFDMPGVTPPSSRSNGANSIGKKMSTSSTPKSNQPKQNGDSTSIVPYKTPTNRKTMHTPRSSDLHNLVNSVTRITRRTSMLMLMSPPTNSETPDRQAVPESITDIGNTSVNLNNHTKNISEGMEITLKTTTPSNSKSSDHQKTLCTTSAMDITNNRSTVSSVQKRRSVLPSRFKDFELNEPSNIGKTGNLTETEHTNQSQKNNRRRTLVITPSQFSSSSSVVSTSSGVNLTSKSILNRRQMVFTPSEKQSSVVSTLNKVAEPQKPASNLRGTLFTPNHTVSSQSGVPKSVPNHRRTLVTPSYASSSQSVVQTSNNEIDETPKSVPNRRQTMFISSQTPSSIDSILNPDGELDSTLTKVPSNSNGSQLVEIANVNSPNPSGTAASNRMLPITPQNRTLFEEYSQRLTFSSTNKRQSINDISLHIIEQRLKNINEIARLNRSVSESDVNIDAIEKCVSERLARSSPQLVPVLENNGTKQMRIANEDIEVPVAKRRKLFDPTTYEETQAVNINPTDNLNNKSSFKSNDRDRVKQIKSTTPRINKLKYQRKSILEFQTEPPKPIKVNGRTTNNQMKYLAYTNMNKDQVNVINQAISKLGKFTVEATVTKNTTHLVTIDSNRTEKLLRAIIRGLWIIDFNWVTASLSAGVWLYEEKFENRSFSNAVMVSRTQAQAVGPKYKLNLFEDIAPIYISSNCRCKNIKELYKMCGGRITNSRFTAKYVVTDEPSKSVYRLLHSNWILDSITFAECKNPSKYILKFVDHSDFC